MDLCDPLNIIQSIIAYAKPAFGKVPDLTDFASSFPFNSPYFKDVFKVRSELKREFKAALFIPVIIYPDALITAAIANEFASSQIKHVLGNNHSIRLQKGICEVN